MTSLICEVFLKNELPDTEMGETGEGGPKAQNFSYKTVSHEAMVTTVDNTVLNIWKLLREQILKCLHHKKKIFCNYMYL